MGSELSVMLPFMVSAPPADMAAAEYCPLVCPAFTNVSPTLYISAVSLLTKLVPLPVT